ncbi:hypothetical protein BVY11_29225 [Pseudomonas amygdali pv. morsprunorum]|nr:hypothetical protein BVY11_29225 [Pseudomonas amygdali pv. morsprunorum]
MHSISNLLEREHYHDAKAQALMGLVYLTGRIVGTYELLREKTPADSLERNLGISLELPGEAINGLSFNWTKSLSQTELHDLTASRHTELINKTIAHCPFTLSVTKDYALDLSLLPLSTLYAILIDLILNDFGSN